MTCAICQRSQRDGFRKFHCSGIDHIETCQTGEVPKFPERLAMFWQVFVKRVLPGLYDGMGGMNYGNIETVMNAEGLSQGERGAFLDLCLTVAQAIRESKKKE